METREITGRAFSRRKWFDCRTSDKYVCPFVLSTPFRLPRDRHDLEGKCFETAPSDCFKTRRELSAALDKFFRALFTFLTPPHSQLLAHGFVLVRHLPSSSTLVETSDLETLDLSLKTATGFSASPDASLSLSFYPSFGGYFFLLSCRLRYPMQAVNLSSSLFFSSFDAIISPHTFFTSFSTSFPFSLFATLTFLFIPLKRLSASTGLSLSLLLDVPLIFTRSCIFDSTTLLDNSLYRMNAITIFNAILRKSCD